MKKRIFVIAFGLMFFVGILSEALCARSGPPAGGPPRGGGVPGGRPPGGSFPPGGGHHGDYHGSSHHHYHGGSRFYFGWGFGFPFYPYPLGYYPYGYYYPYWYPDYRSVDPNYSYFDDEFPIYVEPEQPYYWYYCRDPEGYYPYITSCPGGWTKVVPTPQEEEDSKK